MPATDAMLLAPSSPPPDDAATTDLWWLGVLLMIGSTLAGALGAILMRLSHIHAMATPSRAAAAGFDELLLDTTASDHLRTGSRGGMGVAADGLSS